MIKRLATSLALSLAVAFSGAVFAEDPVPAAVRDCAAKLLRPITASYLVDNKPEEVADWTVVQPLDGSQLSRLRLGLYLGGFAYPRPGVSIVFAEDFGSCILIGGAIEEVLGVPANADVVRSYALAEFNRLIAGRPREIFKERDEMVVGYADAVLALVAPLSESQLLRSVSDIPRKGTADGVSAPTTSVPVRGPVVRRGPEIIRIDMDTWERMGGMVWRNTVFVFRDGRIAVTRVSIGTGVGDLKTPKPVM